jgi:hypothetical protein
MKYIVVVYNYWEQWVDFARTVMTLTNASYDRALSRVVDIKENTTYIPIKNCLWANAEKLRGYTLTGYINISGCDVESDLRRYISSMIRKQEETVTQEKTQWTAKHYDNYYHLTDKDVKEGKVKIDAYFVNKMWKLNEKDDTGALFHCLKTVARFGDKNPIERELNALHNQVKRMAELYGVELK